MEVQNIKCYEYFSCIIQVKYEVYMWLIFTPSIVATDFNKCFRTILDVNTGHDWKNPLSIASINVNGTKLKAETHRYCIRFGSDEVWCVLLIRFSCGGVEDALSWALSGIFQNRFLLSLGPCMPIFAFFLIVNLFYLNTNINPTSLSLPIETNEMCVIGKSGKSSKDGFIDIMVWTFGHPIWMGGPMFVDKICGASDFR